jgi:hypothetical protein
MEFGTFTDFFRTQPHLSISIPPFYFNTDLNWEYTEILPGVIISSVIPVDYVNVQDNNILHNCIKGWANTILMNLDWRHQIERRKCVESIQRYIDSYYPILRSPSNIVRSSVSCKFDFNYSSFKYSNMKKAKIFFSNCWREMPGI